MNIIAIIAATSILQMATEFIDERLSKANPTNSLGRFVGYPIGAQKDRFSFNPKFWAKGVDFSCVSPWNDTSGKLKAGTAISRRHIVFASHFSLQEGDRMTFIGEDGEVCPVGIKETKAIRKTDISIGLLDYELTPNIKPAKILPADYPRHIGTGKGLPVVTFNQDQQAFITELDALSTNINSQCSYLGNSHAPNDGRWSLFRKKIVVGDSGNPAFLLIGNEPILLYCLKFGGCGAGPLIHDFRKDIQAAMDELCPGYKLECFDFSKVVN